MIKIKQMAETPVETTLPPNPEDPTAEEVRFGEVVGCEALNVREKPSMDAPVVTTFTKGSKVTIDWSHPPLNGFYKIVAPDGYCRIEYIKVRR